MNDEQRTEQGMMAALAPHFAHYERPGPVTDALLTHFRATLS